MLKTILSLFLNVLHKISLFHLCNMPEIITHFSICYKTVTRPILVILHDNCAVFGASRPVFCPFYQQIARSLSFLPNFVRPVIVLHPRAAADRVPTLIREVRSAVHRTPPAWQESSARSLDQTGSVTSFTTALSTLSASVVSTDLLLSTSAFRRAWSLRDTPPSRLLLSMMTSRMSTAPFSSTSP